MADTSYLRTSGDIRKTAEAAVTAYELQQHGGKACAFIRSTGVSAGERAYFSSVGQYTLTKEVGIVFLDGDEVFWDHSANQATYRKNNDRDYYAGRAVGDAASADTTVVVNLNDDPRYDIDLRRDAFDSVPTGTLAYGGFGYPKQFGAAQMLELSGTSEAQCIDLFSIDRFAKTANAIIDAIIRVPTNGTGSDVDFNIGIANGTHTTDADSIGEYVFFHVDGGSTTIYAQSKDGTTTVAAVTTATTLTAGSAVANRVHLKIDTRDTENVKLYINGVRVASGSTFKINNATGPFGLLAHLEKSTGTQTGKYIIDRLTARFSEQ